MVTLDVGCGARPKGSINVDLLKPSESYGEVILKIESTRNYIRADACYLPFRDNVFEIVYSSHVLEHLENERRDSALKEMLRVSKRYAKFVLPNRLFDCFYVLNPKYHSLFLWLRKHHKKHYWLKPFKEFPSKLIYHKWLNLIPLPIPFETETIIDKRVLEENEKPRILLTNIGGLDNTGVAMMIKTITSNMKGKFYYHKLTVCKGYEGIGLRGSWKCWGYDIALDLGGDTFTTYYGVLQFLRHSFHLFLLYLFKQPYVLFAQTFSGYGKITGKIARFLMGKAKLITVREKRSKKIVDGLD